MIARAETKDLPAIAALNLEAYREMSAHVPNWTREQFFLSLVESRATHAIFLVVREENTIVGSVAYCPPGQSADPVPALWASIVLLAVNPQHRGKGYGRLLASECIMMTRSDKAEVIGLFTSGLMTSARRLYEGLGFQIDQELAQRHGLRYWLYRYDISISRPMSKSSPAPSPPAR